MIEPYHLDRIRDFNAQLMLLQQAGLPIEISAAPHETLNATLARAATQYHALRMGGASLETSANLVPSIPHRYWQALEHWLEHQQMSTALDLLINEPLARKQSKSTVCVAWIQPWIIFTIASFSCWYLLFHVIPKYENIYRQIHQPWGPILANLVLLRDWILVWGPLAIAAMIAIAAQSIWHRKTKPSPTFPISLKRSTAISASLVLLIGIMLFSPFSELMLTIIASSIKP